MKYYFQCPKCGNDEEFIKPTEEGSKLGSMLFVVSGLMSAILYLDFLEYQRRRVQCVRCAHLFRQPAMPNSPVTKFARWILVVTIGSLIVALLMFAISDLAALLPPSVPVISLIEEAIVGQPRLASYFL